MRFKHLSLLLLSFIAIASSAQVSEKTLDKIVGQLTLDQKARLLVGTKPGSGPMSHEVPGAAGWTYEIPSLNIPAINLADGPVGVRINPVGQAKVQYDANGLPIASTDGTGSNAVTRYCTCFPSTTALAATWNPEMAYLQGQVMGNEAACYGIDVVLAPGVNIMRNPLCGRNFEYYSEDPLLAGKMAASLINGIQSQGIGTSLKHFVANNQQTGKKYNDARISQRALREIYLKPFEICVKEAHPWTVMGSYNKIAGQFTQTNQELLISLLRKEWGWNGLVLTDWTVRRPTADLLNARCALMMPGEEDIVKEIKEVVTNGKVSETTLDNCVKDVLRVVLNSQSAKGWKFSDSDLQMHAQSSREVADESMVLLKNENGLLPLSADKKVALFGASAYQSIAGGTGSSNVNKKYIINIVDGIVEAGFALDSHLADLYNQYVNLEKVLLDNYPNCPDWQKISYHRVVMPEMNLAKATNTVTQSAKANDVAFVVIGRGSGETSDRQEKDDLNLTAEEQTMLQHVSDAFHKQGKKVVVLLNVCGVIETASWRDKVDAILLTWLPGQECGYAVADVVTGKANPSGRLPMTLPIHYSDNPSSLNYPYLGQTEGRNFDYTEYQEDIWVGYRYFTSAHKNVAYPFGYGLSYTTFDYSKAKINKTKNGYDATIMVTNTGKAAGKEVVQLYVHADGQQNRPEAELKAFAKTKLLQPGESETVKLTFRSYDIARFEQENSQWITSAGVYTASFSRSANEVVLSVPFEVKKTLTWPVENILAPVQPVQVIKF